MPGTLFIIALIGLVLWAVWFERRAERRHRRGIIRRIRQSRPPGEGIQIDGFGLPPIIRAPRDQ